MVTNLVMIHQWLMVVMCIFQYELVLNDCSMDKILVDDLESIFAKLIVVQLLMVF